MQRILLLQDNAHPHTAGQALQNLYFEMSEHPGYRSDLVSSVYHLVGPRKDDLKRRRFASDLQVKKQCRSLAAAPSKIMYFESM